jgi:DNA-binding beta-propeller fold protein YncE
VDPVPAWPSGLAVAPGGTVYVADRHGHRLLVLDAAGRPTGVGSRKGWEEGLVLFPAGLALLPDGTLLVADEGNGRVQAFAPVGLAGGAP